MKKMKNAMLKKLYLMLCVCACLALGGCGVEDLERVADLVGLEEERVVEQVGEEERQEEVVLAPEVPEEGIPEYKRDEWQSSGRNSFTDPVRNVKVGMKNYMLAVATGVDITDPNVFEWECWYCGDVTNDYKQVEWDHVVPLFYVHEHGGWAWDRGQRLDYTYGVEVGVNVCRHCNRAKGAKGPADWLPELHVEEYAQLWLDVAEEWGLQLEGEDLEVLQELVGGDS